MNTKIYWSDDELTSLKENYKHKSNNELSILLNKSKRSVVRVLKNLNLKRSKLEKDMITAKICKENGRDLTFNSVAEIAKKYNTKGEFYFDDPSAYNYAIKNKILDKISKHMIAGSFSYPQLIMKHVLEYILGEKCSYNDRKKIKPLELDCYFEKWNIAWEYDGKYFHSNSEKEKRKEDLCQKAGILLFRINENTPEFRNYLDNIKRQLIKQVPIIEAITNAKIDIDSLNEFKPKILFPNLLSSDEKILIKGKKISEIKNLNLSLYKKIRKYRLYENNEYDITNDLTVYMKFKNLEEYLIYLKSCDYKSFDELCKFEHPHRLLKRWNKDIDIIKKLFKSKKK